MDESAVADHAFLGGRLTLREPRRGHRSGTDAVLLAAAARVEPGQHLIDAGAGAGAVALSVLCRVADATATLIERDPAMAALARHNVQINGFEDRADVVEHDIFALETLSRRADVVVSNPPFYLAGEVRASANPQRAGSHVLPHGGHGDWLQRLFRFAVPKGRVVLIHKPEAVPALAAASQGRAGLTLRSIHPAEGQAAIRIIMTANLGRRSPFAIEPPLVLHGEEGAFTTEVDAIHLGRTWL